MPFKSFYDSKKVLVTGDTGFKGSWLVTWLMQLGAEVHGFGLLPNTDPSLFEILRLEKEINHRILDIRDPEKVQQCIKDIRPDVVFHLAAQSLVRLSYSIPLETLDTNFMGMANLLDAIGKAGYTSANPCVVVVITSDKCYENRETYNAYREEDQMGGHDIYSVSKGAVELLVSSWRRSFFTPSDGSSPAILTATCRAGNVIGGGDWAADRVVADSIKMLVRGEPIRVRNPNSIRPWQHVQEPLSGYLHVGAVLGTDREKRSEYLTAWNFGPGRDSERTVGELCDVIVRHWDGGSWEHTPEESALHEAQFLKLSIDKAWHYLGWHPVWDFDKAVEQTVLWYRLAHDCSYDSETMLQKTRAQIEQYMNDAASQSLEWTRSV